AARDLEIVPAVDVPLQLPEVTQQQVPQRVPALHQEGRRAASMSEVPSGGRLVAAVSARIRPLRRALPRAPGGRNPFSMIALRSVWSVMSWVRPARIGSIDSPQ